MMKCNNINTTGYSGVIDLDGGTLEIHGNAVLNDASGAAFEESGTLKMVGTGKTLEGFGESTLFVELEIATTGGGGPADGIILNSIVQCKNFTLTSGVFKTDPYIFRVEGIMTLNAGNFYDGAGAIELSGGLAINDFSIISPHSASNWEINGAGSYRFTPSPAETFSDFALLRTLTISANALLTGDIVTNTVNVTADGPDTIIFTTGLRWYSSTWNILGTADIPLVLMSNSTGNKWYIAGWTYTVEYVAVSDCDASGTFAGGTAAVDATDGTSTDNGGNINWNWPG